MTEPHTLLLGILCLVIVGTTWALVGFIMGHAPKRGIDTGVIQLFGALVPFTVSAILFATGMVPVFSTSLKTGLITGGIYAMGGLLNYFLLQMMARAMQQGPNGIVWAIIQSGLIFPFTMGVVFFGVPLTFTRLFGLVALLCSLALFALSKDNAKVSSRNWLLLSFMAFLVCGIQQMVNNLPSYIPEMRDGVSNYFRTFSTACGVMTAFGLLNFVIHKSAGFGARFQSTVKHPLFWKYVLIKQGFGLVSSYFLMYRGMDMLSKAGIGSASYPLLVGSCIVSFAVYARWVLKERNGMTQCAGLVLCIGGIIMICIT